MASSPQGNGKVTKKQLEDAIKAHEQGCASRVEKRLDSMDEKLDTVTTTLSFMSSRLSELISNQSSRLTGVENVVAGILRDLEDVKQDT